MKASSPGGTPGERCRLAGREVSVALPTCGTGCPCPGAGPADGETGRVKVPSCCPLVATVYQMCGTYTYALLQLPSFPPIRLTEGGARSHTERCVRTWVQQPVGKAASRRGVSKQRRPHAVHPSHRHGMLRSVPAVSAEDRGCGSSYSIRRAHKRCFPHAANRERP